MTENFEVRRVSNVFDREIWDRFVRENPEIGPFYAFTRIEHMVAKAAEEGGCNFSFLVLRENKCVGIAPLILNRNSFGNFFGSGSGFSTVYAPIVSHELSQRDQRMALDVVFSQIDSLAIANNVVVSYMTIDPYQFLDGEMFNWLCRYGYLDASITTNVIDLQQELETLRARRRRSYKSQINNGLRQLRFEVVTRENYNKALFGVYVAFHEKAAGCKTRNSKTFECQEAAILRGEALLIAAFYFGTPVHLVYFNALNKYAYYSSCAEDTEATAKLTIHSGPAILWYAVEYFRSAGFKYLEMGWRTWSAQLFQFTTQKEIDIAFFKEGFGGRNIPLLRGVKYFDGEFMKNDLKERVASLALNIYSKTSRESEK